MSSAQRVEYCWLINRPTVTLPCPGAQARDGGPGSPADPARPRDALHPGADAAGPACLAGPSQEPGHRSQDTETAGIGPHCDPLEPCSSPYLERRWGCLKKLPFWENFVAIGYVNPVICIPETFIIVPEDFFKSCYKRHYLTTELICNRDSKTRIL